ncbi:TIP41-like protein [Dillenia turbinata]|uniref:TIP41-like protein n=1 Tax=Dillenia turbinata TaxID=194707 RepID=A0AAN8W677_9MAGN
MEVLVDEKEIKAAGGGLLPEGRRGLRIHGWELESQKRSILNSFQLQHSLVLKHVNSGIRIHFNACDALVGWKIKPFQQVVLDYDYTFTTPYCGSQSIEINTENHDGDTPDEKTCHLQWDDCEQKIDMASLASREPILFYDELRVDGVLMRMRDTCMHCIFKDRGSPTKGYPSDSAAYNDLSIVSQRLPIIMQKTQILKVPDNCKAVTNP